MSTGGASAAAAAAAAAARRRREEEEMTQYSDKDLAEGWEFKILRSATSSFSNPEKLRAFLEEEAKAGWTLVEKFDNARVRLKRPQSARKLDANLGFDPYRTSVGTSEGMLAAYVVGGMLLFLGVLITLMAVFRR